ncbi:hypothetical protein G3M48_003772 [Beauveria asiatica]|uniref:Beta-lactamase-related domain-containing protein n=1 Tax=Beauveria asiatica TaxID=1069075 RepID=A0AAW0RUI2_9HYPO
MSFATVGATPATAQLPFGHGQNSISPGQSPFTTQFDEYVEALLDEWKVAGLAIGVFDSGRSYTKAQIEAYGYAQLPNVPATTDTLWYVGSTTKAQVAATLAQVIDNQTYPVLARGWETPISSIIRDDFVVSNEWAAAHLTLEDAASHRTGLSGHIDALPNTLNETCATSQDIVRIVRQFPLTYEPRTKWVYNNFMYVTLAHVLETLTGEPLRTTLQSVLWEPLGMTSTFLNLRDVDRSKYAVARGYYWNRERQEFGEHPLWDAPGVSGAGTELSTVEDYTKWLACLIDEMAPLSRRVHADIRKPRMIVQPETEPLQGLDINLYGLAWLRTTIHGYVLLYHTGSTESHGANVVWLPELRYGLVIFLNQPNEVRHVIARKLMEDRIGTPEANRFNVSEFWKEKLAAAEKAIDDAIDTLFPDRPSPPLPSTHTLNALVGEYHHAGYGTLNLRLEANPRNAAERILVADRKNLAFPVQWRFEHVSGDYWAVWRYSYVDTARPSAVYAASVETAVNGAVKSINMKLAEEAAGREPDEIIFSRQG